MEDTFLSGKEDFTLPPMEDTCVVDIHGSKSIHDSYVTICFVAPLARDVCRQMNMAVTRLRLEFP